MQLVGEAGQAERRRLSLLGPVADPELERARLRAPGVEALEHALERQGLDPGLAERLRKVELQACRQLGPTGGHGLQEMPRRCGQQDRRLPVAELDQEPQKIRQERGIGEIVPPGQHRAELAPVGALALPEAAERRPAERVVALDPTARGLSHDHAIEEAQLFGRIGRRVGLGDGAQRRPRPPVVAIEPAPPPGTVGGEVLARCGEIDRPGRLGHDPAQLVAGRSEALARLDQGLERLARALPDRPSAGPCRSASAGSSARLQQASTRSPSWASVGGAGRRPQPLLELARRLEQQRQLLAQRRDRPADRLVIAGQNRRQANAAPGMRGRRPERRDPPGQRLHLIAALAQLGAAPMRGARQGQRRRRRALAVQRRQAADRQERGDPGTADRPMQDRGVAVQPVARRRQLLEQVGRVVPARGAEVEGPLQLLEQALLVGAPAVQLLAELAEPDLVEPALDDLERRHLLGDEQHGLAGVDRGRDQIGDGLRLAGPAAGPG